MSGAAASETVSEAITPSREWRAINFAFSIFLSAFLLFQVQPLVSKFILPWFGGSPAVWTTCMLFFQALLFCGYAYAHFTSVKLAPRQQAVLHTLLLLAASTLCTVVPDAAYRPTDESSPTLRIFLLLSASIGLPYFVLSATGPLLQSWYARAFPGRSAYRLYALSNFGALIALLSYPFVFEPAFDAVTQAWLWRYGFWAFAALCALSAVVNAQIAPDVSAPRAEEKSASVAFSRRLAWVALPAGATIMLLATTNHVCQDVAVIPFLWVAPLALYLLTFIVVFDHPRWYSRQGYAIASFVLCLVVGCLELLDTALGYVGFSVGFGFELAAHFGLLFAICMLCHGELVRLKPGFRHLTEFYLLMSLGGALGGAVVSLLAPALFHSFVEWSGGLVASFLFATYVWFRISGNRVRSAAAAGFGAAALSGGFAIAHEQFDFDPDELEAQRSFYGVVGVYEVDREDPELRHRSLTHGIVVHGRQFTAPEKRSLPLAYYGPEGGVGRAVTLLQSRPNMRLGVVGLGVGTLATYVKQGQSARFYEINPQVRDLAERYFTYLADSAGKVEHSMGDARIALEREPAQGFDALVLDAFSGDSVPVHLLTQEAFAVYARHLRPDGVLAVNITNHKLDLSSVVASVGELQGFRAVRIACAADEEALHYPSVWMLLSRDSGVLTRIAPEAEAQFNAPKRIVWTDRYSDLLSVLK